MSDDDILTGPREPYDGDPYITTLVPPEPIPVTVVSEPIRSVLRYTDLITVVGQSAYVGITNVPVPTAPMLSLAVQALPYDDTRTRADFFLAPSINLILAASWEIHAVWALSTDSGFATYATLSGTVAADARTGLQFQPIVIRGKSPVYVAPIFLKVPAAAPVMNAFTLNVNVTRETLVNETY